ncbi:MAG: hypothetical protein K2H52_16150 [Lachnospiraceae bacterium]|nr:hypothetical protein [Lachnospiraceae bacterium]
MIGEIVDAVGLALNEAFGNHYAVYREETGKDMDAPCFFVYCSAQRNAQISRQKYLRSNTFCIQYIPSTTDIRAECNEVIERLFDCLEYIKVESSLLRGRKMEAKIKDGVAHFFLNYDFYVYKKEETEAMGTLTRHIEVKGQVEDGCKEKSCGE